MAPEERDNPGLPRATTVVDIVPRSRVALSGVVTAVRPGRWHGVRACLAVLDDGTGRLDLVFTGRERVGGLREGANCRVEGTALPESGGWMVWNPELYVEVPADGDE